MLETVFALLAVVAGIALLYFRASPQSARALLARMRLASSRSDVVPVTGHVDALTGGEICDDRAISPGSRMEATMEKANEIARKTYGATMAMREPSVGYAAAHELAYDAAVADVMAANGDDRDAAVRATLRAAVAYIESAPA